MKLWIVSLVTVLGLSLLSYLPVYSTSMLATVEANLDMPTVEPVRVEAQPLQVPVYHSPAVTLGDAGQYAPPDFSAYEDSEARKQAFYDYLLPKIHKANRQVLRERQWLLMLRQKVLQDQALTAQELEELATFETRYGTSGDGSVASRVGDLLNRVDVVPASLVVAQAAKESGWGTSRFARQANNFFGIWCFYEGCGIKPKRREEGRTHEVATFRTVEDGIRYYIRTINTHWAYDDLRSLRAVARRQNQSFGGERLAVGLVLYSERGTDYVEEIQSMIRINRLHRFSRTGDWAERPGSV